MSFLTTAISIAEEVHVNQTDKAGRPYIEHVEHVASKVRGDVAKSVAYLHDVLEDGAISEGELLLKGIPVDVVNAVVSLTRKKGESYNAYIHRVGTNNLAIAIKLVDLAHNADMTRLEHITTSDIKRTQKYLSAMKYLMELPLSV